MNVQISLLKTVKEILEYYGFLQLCNDYRCTNWELLKIHGSPRANIVGSKNSQMFK